jgi:ligand-binding sensor domain-containing protein
LSQFDEEYTNLALVKYLLRLFLGLLLLTGEVSGQSYDFRHYQVEQGLSYNSVFGILQDSKGFMWFATKDGLNRFDGYNFKIFRNNPTDSTSIGSNLNLCLFEDSRHTLWIGTSKGLYQYNDTLERFSLIAATRNRYVLDIKSDKSGRICVLFDGKVYSYDVSTRLLKLYSRNQDFRVSSMLFNKDGTLWVSTSAGFLNEYVAGSDSFRSYDLFKHSKFVSSHWIDRIYLSAANSILVGTSHQGAKLFDLKTLDYKDILTKNTDGTAVFAKNFIHYRDNTYWIATESGIFVYDLVTGKYTQLKKDHANPYALSDNAVYTFGRDKEGGVWAGTYFGGVNYYPMPFTSFEKYFPGGGVFPIRGNAVREITKDKYGNLWVATEDAGLNKIKADGQAINFVPGADKQSIAHTNIHGILALENELWIGTFEQGLDVLDIPSGKVIRHYDKGNGPDNIKSDFVECIYRTKNGTVLLGTSSGLYSYNRSPDTFSPVRGFPQNNHYMSIVEDQMGTLWAGTINNGLHYFNPVDNKYGVFKARVANPGSMSDNSVNSLFIDNQNVLWTLTENGLNKFNAKKQSFAHYGTGDGFPSNVFYRMQQDASGLLWVSSARGLISFNPKGSMDNVKVYSKANGLLNDQFNYNSSFLDSSEKLYFGSVNGMIAFNPALFRTNTLSPKVYITGLQVFNKEVTVDGLMLKRALTYTSDIELAYDQSTFSIDFAALAYTNDATSEYEYKLEGVDKSYTHLNNNRRVFYTKLSPGRYVFFVRGSNSSGIWSKQPTKLVILIRPPFWRTDFAYVFYGLLFACLKVGKWKKTIETGRFWRIKRKGRFIRLKQIPLHI